MRMLTEEEIRIMRLPDSHTLIGRDADLAYEMIRLGRARKEGLVVRLGDEHFTLRPTPEFEKALRIDAIIKGLES